jgi:hypothetical protein
MMDYPGTVYNITSDTPLDPAVTGMVWDAMNEEEVYIAIVLDKDGYDEIFMNPFPLSLEFVNFTNSGTMNQNPQFFVGEIEGMIYNWSNYLIWESFRNNHWQIWFSKVFMGFSDTPESGIEDYSSKAYPNPFTTSTTIEFALNGKSKIQISIFNTVGEMVYQYEETYDPGTHNVSWSPGHIPAGIYFGVLKFDDNVEVIKLLKQ